MTTTYSNQATTWSTYSGATAYVVGDVVKYLNQLYKCILNSTGNLPTNGTYWTTLYTNETKH